MGLGSETCKLSHLPGLNRRNQSQALVGQCRPEKYFLQRPSWEQQHSSNPVVLFFSPKCSIWLLYQHGAIFFGGGGALKIYTFLLLLCYRTRHSAYPSCRGGRQEIIQLWRFSHQDVTVSSPITSLLIQTSGGCGLASRFVLITTQAGW